MMMSIRGGDEDYEDGSDRIDQVYVRVNADVPFFVHNWHLVNAILVEHPNGVTAAGIILHCDGCRELQDLHWFVPPPVAHTGDH